MKIKLIIAAFGLLAGVNLSNGSYSASKALQEMAFFSEMMSQQTETILIEDHAAPHWNLTIAQAWNQYNKGQIKIIEIEPDYRYTLVRGGDNLDVVLDLN